MFNIKPNGSKLLFGAIFVLISLTLLTSPWLKNINNMLDSMLGLNGSIFYTIDPKDIENIPGVADNGNIYVPPAEDSHPKTYISPPGNNIPGILPGGFLDMLGLENNPVLDLSTPIKAPLLDNCFSKKRNTQNLYSQPIKNRKLLKCLRKGNKNARVTTMPASGYYKYRYEQCNPYNGSYCQCTNNYMPLPNVGRCQPNGWSEDVCPYRFRLKPAVVYNQTQKCLS